MRTIAAVNRSSASTCFIRNLQASSPSAFGAQQFSHDTEPLSLFASGLLQRPWLLPKPDSQIRTLAVNAGKNKLQVIQDDLLHPVLGGNKLRKLDALLPELQTAGCTDVLTCGGVQSAHTAAVAAACAEQGITAHLLIRGERPAVPTGFHLLARMYGRVEYVTRAEYANRDTMLQKHAELLKEEAPADIKRGSADLQQISASAGSDLLKVELSENGAMVQLHIIPEGAGQPAALLGCIRLVHWLAQPHALGPQPLTLVLDCGTGTTATGLAIGIELAQLPWTVHGVMLAGAQSYYEQQQTKLAASFAEKYSAGKHVYRLRRLMRVAGQKVSRVSVEWAERTRPRRFGKVFPEDVHACQQVAQQHGILLDPIYSLSAWEVACQLAAKPSDRGTRVSMLHTGGSLGLQGIAQRHPEWF